MGQGKGLEMLELRASQDGGRSSWGVKTQHPEMLGPECCWMHQTPSENADCPSESLEDLWQKVGSLQTSNVSLASWLSAHGPNLAARPRMR